MKGSSWRITGSIPQTTRVHSSNVKKRSTLTSVKAIFFFRVNEVEGVMVR